MANRVTWDNIRLRNILKADCFSESLEIQSEDGISWEPFVDRSTFFDQIYVEIEGKSLELSDGSKNNIRNVPLERWMNKELSQSGNSLVVFIEGYAGCGKSIFVQNLLKSQLKTINYESNYYNYDIGAYFANHEAHRISDAIRECLLRQMSSCVTNKNMEIIHKFRQLLSQNEIKHLDSGRNIFYQLPWNGAFGDAVQELQENGDCEDFCRSMKDQLEGISCEQLLALDCVFRIAKYIVTAYPHNSAIYMCYDNLDAIENFDELSTFHETLISLRRNLDRYIEYTSRNYEQVLSPHFIIISTYRKITLSRVESAIFSERCGDYGEDNCYIQHIDASHFYKYSVLVEKRRKYFNKYLKARGISSKPIKRQLSVVSNILSMEFIQKRYAGLWNNNYRTCSDIFDNLFIFHEDEIKECVNLLKLHEDGYDEIGDSYYGASAVFLNLICRLFTRYDIWGPNHLALVPLGRKRSDSVSQLTSLSRLILTYMSNSVDEDRNPKPVSTQQLFEEFGAIYSPDQICRSISNMLIRDKTGTWRRPIFYHRNAINTGTIQQNLKNQWGHYIKGENYDYTELLLCDCGYTYINRVVFEFEFFSVRLHGIGQKPLYVIDNIQDIQAIIGRVHKAIEDCCENMVRFKAIYQRKKEIKHNEAYVKSFIHPRTYRRNPQLHTERIIFSHISYLDHCRRYYIHSPECDFAYANNICRPFLNGIEKYLTLYNKYVNPINPSRRNVYDELLHQLSEIRQAKTKDDLLRRIEMHRG